MRIAIESFRGEAPRVTSRALPPNAAQLAINPRLQSGDLETWRGLLEAATLVNDAETIYLLNGAWLSWAADVDVARGTIPGDTTFRTYLTGPDVYSQPRFTNYALATTGSQPYPVTTRPLGVPAPESAPTYVIGVDNSSEAFNIDVLDEGDVLDTKWQTSSPGDGGGLFTRVEQVAGSGNPPPSYKITYDEVPSGREAYAYRNFGIVDSAVIHFSADFLVSEDTGVRQAVFGIHATEAGSGVQVQVRDGTLIIANARRWSPYDAAVLDTAAIGTVSMNTWYTIDVTITTNSDNSNTVTARVFLGSGQVGSDLVTTGNFDVGDFCGIVNAVPNDAASRYETFYDNIHVVASGSVSFEQVNSPTSYVYTFVNDLGEESAPSPPSSTLLRPDGVTVTVTTPTSIPSGISSEYGIATKRIYRAAVGNTGTVFRFVAEIDLDVADYDDTLTDAQLGEVLESDEFDLPPDDMRGILALPNGIMVGFSKNQLCLSAQNRPHAWPVSFRLTTDTDIVSISNIDNTVVIGTEAYPYMATGTDPASYSMTKLEVQQACVSKRSIGTITDIGVVFASPDGLIAVRGPGQVRNLTENVFTRRQWQDIGPGTIRAVVHDDIYFFWTGDGSSGSDQAFALDMKQNGFGLIRLSIYADAMHADPLTDKLYLAQIDPPAMVADWLGYNFDDLGPTMQSFGAFVSLGSPIPFSNGVSFTNNFANNLDVVWVPLSTSADSPPILTEGVNWFPDVGGDPPPNITAVDPSEGTWVGFSFVIEALYSGYVVFEGVSGTTTVTISIVPGGGSNYDGASLEYAD